MAWISPIEFNMSISRNIYEWKSDVPLLATAQKIAIYLVIPLAFVVFFEAVVKNLFIFNVLNLGIVVINYLHDTYFGPQEPVET